MSHVATYQPSCILDSDGIRRFDQLQRANDKLRRDNRDLTAHLELAIAYIQRLTLDNHEFRLALGLSGVLTLLKLHRRVVSLCGHVR